MHTVAFLGMLSFGLGMALTPLFRALALRFNLVDHPDEIRKLHARPIPRVGGIAVVLAYGGALALVFLLTPNDARLHVQHLELLYSLLPGATVIFLTGVIDDLKGIRPKIKLMGETAGAVLTLALGIHFSPESFRIGAHAPLLADTWVSLLLSFLWLVACTNAVNLIDGLDGLASGVGLFASVATLLVGIFTRQPGLVLVTMPLVGALLAFLVYNFNPASIFLGDSGSLTVGFMLGVFSLVWSQHSSSMLGFAAPLMVLALPLLDVCLAIIRRYLTQSPIFGADRGHIHHIVQARGFKARDTTLILYAVCGIAASLSLLQSLNFRLLRYAVVVVFIALVWAGIRYLNYAELGAARRAFSRIHLWRMVKDDVYLRELDRALEPLTTPAEFWDRVCHTCKDLSFVSAEMYFDEQYFEAIFDESASDRDWQMTLPLGERGYLRLSRSNDALPPSVMLQALDKLRFALARREQLRPRTLSFTEIT